MASTYDGGPIESLTVRDHFAAHALTGMLAQWGDPQAEFGSNIDLARDAYALADAMLAARERGE